MNKQTGEWDTKIEKIWAMEFGKVKGDTFGIEFHHELALRQIQRVIRSLLQEERQRVVEEIESELPPEAKTYEYEGESRIYADFSGVGGMKIKPLDKIKFTSTLTDEEKARNSYRQEVLELLNNIKQ